MLKKLVFCITELWTEHIKKFESEANHFVPNVLSVKNSTEDPCIAVLPDPLFTDDMARHVFCPRNFEKSWSLFDLLR